MARKPPDWHQPTLFPPDSTKTPEPQDNATPTEGDHHAVQDNRSRTPATTPTDARATTEGTEAPGGNGTLRQGAEDQPRGVEGNPRPTETGQRPEPDRERGAG